MASHWNATLLPDLEIHVRFVGAVVDDSSAFAVVALIVLDTADSPTALTAEMRYVYCVPAARPVWLKLVLFPE